MKRNSEYSDRSTAEKFAINFKKNYHLKSFCNVTFRRKVLKKCVNHGPWGGDDTMYWFEDGSMIQERNIVKEWQLFKA